MSVAYNLNESFLLGGLLESGTVFCLMAVGPNSNFGFKLPTENGAENQRTVYIKLDI